jgi:hypothetical protein
VGEGRVDAGDEGEGIWLSNHIQNRTMELLAIALSGIESR